jgi:hypothetical protein
MWALSAVIPRECPNFVIMQSLQVKLFWFVQSPLVQGVVVWGVQMGHSQWLDG